MKTAVIISDELYRRAEGLARRRDTSPDAVVGEALEQYLARQTRITEAMDLALEDAGEEDSAFVSAAAHRVLANTEW